jgi:hypothetical protein
MIIYYLVATARNRLENGQYSCPKSRYLKPDSCPESRWSSVPVPGTYLPEIPVFPAPAPGAIPASNPGTVLASKAVLVMSYQPAHYFKPVEAARA